MSDTHLGYRQYNLEEREQDIYDVLEEITDKILEERVDFVVHCGDLFDSWRPTTQAYYAFKGLLNKLKGKVKVFTILGDHDVPKRRGMPPHILFDDRIEILGIDGADHRVLRIDGEEVLVAGISSLSRRYRQILVEELKKLDFLAEKYRCSVLMLHQAIKRFLPFEEAFELTLDEVPRNFRYCAMGHLHARVRASHGAGELAYSGSTEIMRKNETSEWEKHGKGFYLVDVDRERMSLHEINIDKIRPQVSRKFSYADFQSELEKLVSSIPDNPKLPIAHIVVEGKQIDRQSVHQALNEALAGKALQVRPDFVEDSDKRTMELKPGYFNIGEMLREYLCDKEMGEFGLELFKILRQGDMDEAKRAADEYFGSEKGIDAKKSQAR